MKVAMLLALGLLVAHAAEPTGTLTLACQGTETRGSGASTTAEQISIGVIVDFQNKKVVGLSDDLLSITSLDETMISFAGNSLPGSTRRSWVMNGTIDRITGMLDFLAYQTRPCKIQSRFHISCNASQRSGCSRAYRSNDGRIEGELQL